jgi:hypothetical protein
VQASHVVSRFRDPGSEIKQSARNAALRPARGGYFASVPGARPGSSCGLITGMEPDWSGFTTVPVVPESGGLMTPSFCWSLSLSDWSFGEACVEGDLSSEVWAQAGTASAIAANAASRNFVGTSGLPGSGHEFGEEQPAIGSVPARIPFERVAFRLRCTRPGKG